ncbi:MAG: hydroxymethylbilane synthase [Candidatus Margulisiibacteriota bacterium]
MRKIRIGTRGSRLALVQVNEVVEKLGIEDFEIVVFETRGDRDKNTPLDQVEGTDFFTDRIEEALLKKEIDLAVHSAKDLPDQLPEGLEIAVVTDSIDPADVLVSRGNQKLTELPSGAKVGTSSQRRKEQIQRLRPDLRVADLRGNIEERLAKLDGGEYDAIVIAAAGLIRLGLQDRIAERLPFETAKGQGSLAIEVRKDDQEIVVWLKEKFIS